MRRLVPVDRARDQFGEGLVRGHCPKRPVEVQRRHPRDEPAVLRPERRGAADRDVDDLGQKEKPSGREKQPPRDHPGKWVRQTQWQKPERPEYWRQHALRQRSQKQHLHAEKARGPKVRHQPPGRLGMHGPSQGIALEPARPLPDPGPGPEISLLLGHRRDQLGLVAASGEADTEVGILGHIVRVPSAKRLERSTLEEQRRALQWDDQAKTCHLRQDHPEPRRVIHREAAREPFLPRVG